MATSWYEKTKVDSLFANVYQFMDSKISAPASGTTGQFLQKTDSGTQWATVTATGGGGGTGGVSATVDGNIVNSLAFTTAVTASDVGAVPAGNATRLSVLAYGVKNDGIILNDLVVTAGSTQITSATAPFTSTAVDAGKMVMWRVGTSNFATGTIATVTNSTTAQLTTSPANGSTSDGGPNTNGAIGTDNTAALNSVFAAAQAKQTATTQQRIEHTTALGVHFPGGVYLSRALNVMTGRGITVSGDGNHATFICNCDSTPLFQLGVFNNNPSYVFNGGYNQEFWNFRDIQFINPVMRNGSTEGNRNSTAIQDNGNGNVRIQNCVFMGHKYGFAGAYATDFSDMYGNFFYLCDVGAYFGPGSQQLDISKTDFSYCKEGVVFEGCEQWHIGSGSSFEDNYIASVTIDGTTGSATRFGLPRAVSGSWYNGNMVIDGNTWFETNSGNSTRLSPRQIWITGDGPYGRTFSRFVMRDAFVVAGGTQVSGGTNTLVEIATNNSSGAVEAQVILENIVVGGNYLNSIVRSSGNASATAHLRDISKENAATALTQGSITTRQMTLDGKLVNYTITTG